MKKDNDIGRLIKALEIDDSESVSNFLMSRSDARQLLDCQLSSKTCDGTPLMIAASCGASSSVTKLLEAGSNIHAKNDDLNTAILCCAYEGNVETMRILIDHEANINDVDDSGQNILMKTAKGNTLDMLNFVMSLDIDIESRDNEGMTSLMYAACDEDAIENFIHLVSKGADIHAHDYLGRSVLNHAESNQNDSVIDFIHAINEQRHLDHHIQATHQEQKMEF